MDQADFLRQDEQPLFPNLLWNRPVNTKAAGSLLIIGGHTGDFSLVQAIHQSALAAGAGKCQVVLPDALNGLLAGTPDTTFVPSNSSGSIDKEALSQILNLSQEYSAVVLGANLSNNSSTAVLAEGLATKLGRPLVVCTDAWEALKFSAHLITERADRLALLTTAEAMRIAGRLKIPVSIQAGGGVMNKIRLAHNLLGASSNNWFFYEGELITAADLKISLTQIGRHDVAGAVIGVAATFWMQNLAQPFEALTTAAYVLHSATQDAARQLPEAIKATVSKDL